MSGAYCVYQRHWRGQYHCTLDGTVLVPSRDCPDCDDYVREQDEDEDEEADDDGEGDA